MSNDELLREEIELLERKKAALENRKQGRIQSSRLAAVIQGINQGVTFGFADEIGAGIGALAQAPFSDKSFSELYGENLEKERENLGAAQEQFPGTTLTSTVAGGIGSGVGAAKAGSTLLQNVPRLPRIAGLGAAEGGLFGAGMAEDDRIAGAAKGAAIGAVGAPVGSGLATAIGRVGKKLTAPLVRAAANTPRRQANRIVERALEFDELGPASTQAELRRLGPDATLADLGENLSGLARGVAAKPGQARTIASNLLNDRQRTQQARLLRAAGVDFDIDDFKRSFNAAMNNRQSAAAPLYREAYAQPLTITPKLASLLKRPIMKSLMKKASRILQDEGGGTGHVRLMDAAKRDLDDRIGSALRNGRREEARRLLNIKRDLLEEIDSQVPSYRQARELYSSEASLRDSANLGRSMLTSRVNLDDAEIAVEAMTAGERQAFQMGSIRGLIDKLEGTPETRNAAQKLIESKRARDLLRVAFPDDSTFNRFLQTARAEANFSFTRNRVLGGSPTARIQEEVGDLTKEAGIASALRGGDPLSMGVQLLRHIGMGDVSDETLEQVSRILFSRNAPRQARAAFRTPVTIPEIPRQGGVAGATGAIIGQQINE